MSGINKILGLLAAGLFLTTCQTVNIPEEYKFSLKETEINVYGCWMNVIAVPGHLRSVPDSISGELICVDADTVFLLVSDSMICPVYSGSILHAELYTHRNQAGTYGIISLLSVIPNLAGAIAYTENAGPFLLMALPAAIAGLALHLWENAARRNILEYPEKNSLDDLSLFARFPAGKPVNVNFNQLTLKRIY